MSTIMVFLSGGMDMRFRGRIPDFTGRKNACGEGSPTGMQEVSSQVDG
jgi:hypothetical protein